MSSDAIRDRKSWDTDYLIQRYLEETLVPDEADELLERLERCPETRLLLFENAELNLFLRSTFGTQVVNPSSSATVPDMDALARQAAEAEPVPSIRTEKMVDRSKGPENTGRSLRPLKYLLPIIFLVWIGMMIHEFRPAVSESESKPLARVIAVADPGFSEDLFGIKKGQALGEETLRLESGLLELQLLNGTRLVLEGPTTINLQDPMKAFCREGRLSVEVPKHVTGFEVRTPFMTVRDLSTAFVITVSPTESAVHHISGRMEINRLDNDWTTVPERAALIVSEKKEMTQSSADRTLYVDPQRMSESAQRYEDRCMRAWAEQIEQTEKDPSLLIHFDFENIDGRSVPNRSIHAAETGRGTILGGRITEGRWKEKSGLEYRAKKDAVELRVSRPLKSFTLLASLCLETVGKQNQAIFASRFGRSGRILWQIRKDGSIFLGIQPENGGSLHHFTTPPSTFRPFHCGAWYSLAAVFDRDTRTVGFYLDGRKIHTQTISLDISLELETITIGNDFFKGADVSKRHLVGKIDLFQLYERALSEDEIQKLSSDF